MLPFSQLLNSPHFQGKLLVPVKWDSVPRENGAISLAEVTHLPSSILGASPTQVIGGPNLIGGQDGTVYFDYGNDTQSGIKLANALQQRDCHFISDAPDTIPSYQPPASKPHQPSMAQSLAGRVLSLSKRLPLPPAVVSLAARVLKQSN
jgi:hypothetical protein